MLVKHFRKQINIQSKTKAVGQIFAVCTAVYTKNKEVNKSKEKMRQRQKRNNNYRNKKAKTALQQLSPKNRSQSRKQSGTVNIEEKKDLKNRKP